MNKQKRDPDERVAHMNEIFDKYIVPMLLFTLAVVLIFGVAVPLVRSCSDKSGSGREDGGQRDYSSAEFYIRRSLLLDGVASDTDIFENAGCMVLDDGNGGKTLYAKLDDSCEIFENVTDPNGNRYSAVTAADSYGESTDRKNLTLMIYSSTLFLAIAEEEDGTYSALFDNESFIYPASDTDAHDLLYKVSPAQWSRMLEEYKQWLTPLLRQAEDTQTVN